MGFEVSWVAREGTSAERGSFGELKAACFGYGLHQAWVFAVMFSSGIFGSQGSLPLGAFEGQEPSLLMMVSVAVYAICLIFCGVTDQKYLMTYVSHRFSAFGGVLMALGTCLAFLLHSTGSEIAAGVLTGVGSAFMVLSWGIVFARLDAFSVVLNTSVSAVLAVVLYLLVLHWLPEQASGFVVALLPLAEWAVLHRQLPVPFYDRGELPSFAPIPVNKVRFVFVLCVSVLLFGVVLGVLRKVSIQSIVPHLSLGRDFAILLAAAVASMLALLFSRILSDEDLIWSGLFRIVVPIIAVACVFLSQAHFGLGMLGSFVVMVAYFCTESLMWSFFGAISQRFRLSPVLVFGCGRGALGIGILVGTLLLPAFGGSDGQSAMVVPSVVSLVLVMAYACLPNERDIQKVVVSCPLVRAVTAGVFHDLSFDSSDRAPCSTVRQGTPPDSSESVDERSGESRESSKMWFKNNCALIASRYMLSRREADVLFLLAKGNNCAAIQEKLVIAEGTAKTHIRHIYRKLDVHTQQELMRMVEEADR